ncbi:hypothetical protein PLIIFM63780_004115 [Purpureocillium lilacinum]|nr:hypothetical protein PLIIFM63780_004115 [Purpureocillium lilacinum]
MEAGAASRVHQHPYYPPGVAIPGWAPDDAPRLRQAPLFVAVIGAIATVAYRYYIYNRTRIAGLQTPFAHLWKEYALSDSRYLTSDVFTVCVETITVFAWGPLCLLTTISILVGSSSRHVNQAIICTAHLYGVALYYATNWAEQRFAGVSYSRPEFLYYWVYYVGFNMPWAVVPLVLLYDSYAQVGKAFGALQDGAKQRKNT